MLTIVWLLAVVFGFFALAYINAEGWLWTAAIAAGTVWWDGDLFSGNPDWEKLLAMPQPKLSSDEQRFLDRECNELCAMVSDWETTQVYRDLPAHAWQYVKDKGFLGMIIPKR